MNIKKGSRDNVTQEDSLNGSVKSKFKGFFCLFVF